LRISAKHPLRARKPLKEEDLVRVLRSLWRKNQQAKDYDSKPSSTVIQRVGLSLTQRSTSEALHLLGCHPRILPHCPASHRSRLAKRDPQSYQSLRISLTTHLGQHLHNIANAEAKRENDPFNYETGRGPLHNLIKPYKMTLFMESWPEDLVRRHHRFGKKGKSSGRRRC